MGKGKKKQRAGAGSIDVVMDLERHVEDMRKEILFIKDVHRKEMVDICERWKQSINDHKKKMFVPEDSSRKVDESLSTIQALREVVKEEQIKVIVQDRKIASLEDKIEVMKTDYIILSKNMAWTQKDSLNTIANLTQQLDTFSERYLRKEAVVQKNHEYKMMILHEQADKELAEKLANQRSEIEASEKEKYILRFKEEFHTKHEDKLKQIVDDQKRRQQQVVRRNKEHVVNMELMNKKIAENDEIRTNLSIEQKQILVDKDKQEQIHIESLQLQKEIESMKGEYSETEENISLKKKELEIIELGTNEAIMDYRIRNGEIIVHYYTLDEIKNQEHFYDDDIQKELLKISMKDNDVFETKIGKWEYKFLFVSDCLIQINKHTKKSRPVLYKHILLSEMSVPIRWSKSSMISESTHSVNLVQVDRHSDEFMHVVDYFKVGWFAPGDSYYRDISQYKIRRIENKAIWGKYTAVNYDQTNPINKRHQYHSDISQKSEEYLCWHGTDMIKATNGEDGIVESGARIYWSGSGSGSLYGKGFYTTSQSKKADQYCKDSNWKTMLLCGINMGKIYHTNTQHPNADRPPAKHDSIYAAGGIANYGRQNHDEYVVFDSDQIYPYYILEYR